MAVPVTFHHFGESSPMKLFCSWKWIKEKRRKIVQLDHCQMKREGHQAPPVPDTGYLQYKAI